MFCNRVMRLHRGGSREYDDKGHAATTARQFSTAGAYALGFALANSGFFHDNPSFLIVAYPSRGSKNAYNINIKFISVHDGKGMMVPWTTGKSLLLMASTTSSQFPARENGLVRTTGHQAAKLQANHGNHGNKCIAGRAQKPP